MRALLNCSTTVVSLYCDDDDDDCVITNYDFIAGYWVIGDPSTDTGGVESDDPAEDLLPHQVRWSQVKGDGGWWNDPQLTVIGNINIQIFSDFISIIFYQL